MKKLAVAIVFVFLLILAAPCQAERPVCAGNGPLRVLFIGNSYTFVNKVGLDGAQVEESIGVVGMGVEDLLGLLEERENPQMTQRRRFESSVLSA